jgi:protein tyrosine phosphatase
VAKLFPDKNRSSDSIPYDHARVLLPTTTDDYINAAYVKVRHFCRISDFEIFWHVYWVNFTFLVTFADLLVLFLLKNYIIFFSLCIFYCEVERGKGFGKFFVDANLNI